MFVLCKSFENKSGLSTILWTEEIKVKCGLLLDVKVLVSLELGPPNERSEKEEEEPGGHSDLPGCPSLFKAFF